MDGTWALSAPTDRRPNRSRSESAKRALTAAARMRADAQAVVGLLAVVLDQDGLVGAHGQALLRSTVSVSSPPRLTARDRAAVGLAQPQGLLDGVFVVGADDEVQAVLDDGRRYRAGSGSSIPCPGLA